MKEEQLQEIQHAVELATQGNWLPIGVIGAIMILVLTLLIYIWNDKLKINDQKHEGHKDMLCKLTETNQKIEVLLERTIVQTEHHASEIKDLKQKVRA